MGCKKAPNPSCCRRRRRRPALTLTQESVMAQAENTKLRLSHCGKNRQWCHWSKPFLIRVEICIERGKYCTNSSSISSSAHNVCLPFIYEIDEEEGDVWSVSNDKGRYDTCLIWNWIFPTKHRKTIFARGFYFNFALLKHKALPRPESFPV